MNKTVWKPIGEIEYLLNNKHAFTILACSLCANLSGTGGAPGIKIMKRILKELNKNVVKSRIIMTCCEEYMMTRALEKYKKSIQKSDALILLCCAGGVKTAYISHPDIHVISPLDPVGSVPITHKDTAVSRSICKTCGSCVISYTGGICPLSECPAKSKYGSCKNAPVKGVQCTVEPERDCVWKEIEEKGYPEQLVQLRKMHASRGDSESVKDSTLNHLIPAERSRKKPSAIKKMLARFAVRMPLVDKMVGVFR